MARLCSNSYVITVYSDEKHGKKPIAFTMKVTFEGAGKTRVEMKSVVNDQATEEGLVEGDLDGLQPGQDVKIRLVMEQGTVKVCYTVTSR